MARKSAVKPGEIDRWMARYVNAKRVRDDADARYGYSRSILEYQGDYKSAMPSFVKDAKLVPINEVYGYAKTFVPSVYSRDPHISFNPRGRESIGKAKMMELAINAYWRDLGLKREARRCIYDGIFAEGWMKVGYSAIFGSISQDDGSPLFDPSEYVKDEEIFAKRVSWRRMTKDPDAVNGIHDARYVIEDIFLPIEAVRASGLYDKAADLKPTNVLRLPESNQRQAAIFDEMEYVLLHEIWDRDSQRVLTISEGADWFLMNKPWPYKVEGFPYALLRFNDNGDEPYAPNLIGPWEPQLWEKIKLRAMALDHIKRFNRQMQMEEGTLSRAELSKFESGKTGSVITRKKGTPPLEAIPYPQIQTDIYAVESRIDLDKDNVSGQPNAVRSAPQKTQSRTLGEVNTMIAAFQARQSDPQDVVEDFIEEVASKLAAVMMEHLPGEKFVRATSKQAQEVIAAIGVDRFDGTGFKITRQDIQGAEFEIDVKAGSTLPLNRENRMDSMTSLLKLGPTIGITPNGKVSLVIGKNLTEELELIEIEQAYDEVIAEMEAAKQVQRAAAYAQNDMAHEQIAQTRSDLAGMMGANGGGQ